MNYSVHVKEFKEVQKQIDDLTSRRKEIVKAMIPDVTKAILNKMSWPTLKFGKMDYTFFGDIKVDVSNPAESEWHRYVFTVIPGKNDGDFQVDLDFREVFKDY